MVRSLACRGLSLSVRTAVVAVLIAAAVLMLALGVDATAAHASNCSGACL
jgi:hypothetical protein